LHLKRFEYSSAGKYRTYTEKIGSLVDFPKEDQNLKNFIIGPHEYQTSYDLYAVSQHFGDVWGGHYTVAAEITLNGMILMVLRSNSAVRIILIAPLHICFFIDVKMIDCFCYN